jgi:hypothetical protein
MSAYNVSLQGNITGYGKVISAIKRYNTLSTAGADEQNAFATAVAITNGKLGNYLTGLNGAKASLAGYGISLIASTVKTVALTVATAALNAALTMGISAIITGIITAFTAWINKADAIAKKAQEAKDAITSLKEELQSNTETVNNAKQRYAELAQEVDNLGTISQNRGTLSSEDYEEFLDLSNQLAGVFPQLTKGYDDNGNAILDLSGNVNTIVDSLDDLLQKEKELANQKIMEEFPDVFSGFQLDLSKAQQSAESAQTEFNKINDIYQKLGAGAQTYDIFYADKGQYNTSGLSLGQYEEYLRELGLEYKESQEMAGYTYIGQRVEVIGDINDAFTSKLEKARENLKYTQQEL